jgi:uncharacterized membrane protein
MKVWNYMAIMLTMMVFLYFLGFNPAGTSSVLSSAGVVIDPTTGELITGDVANSTWFDMFFGGLGILTLALTGGAIIIGLFTKSFEWKLVVLPFFTFFVFKFLSFGWGIVQLAKDTGESWLVAIIATIFIPLTIMFGVSIIEWFGGTGGD